MFNISELIQNQIPDQDGNLIPPGVYEGSARISGASGAENENILIAMDAGTYNVRKATCTWRCNNCNGLISGGFYTAPFSVAVGSTTQVSLKDTWNTGTQHDLTNIATWTSNSTNLATVSKGVVTGVNPGTVTIDGVDQYDPVSGQQCGAPPDPCPFDMGLERSGSGTVQVPTSLSIVAGTDSTTAEAACSGGGCGCTRSFTYQVNDQTGNPMRIAGLDIWDAISTTSPNNLNLTGYTTTCSPPNSGPCGITTNQDGQFQERSLNACAPACKSNNACIKAGPTNANQTWYVGSGQIVQHIGYYCDHVTVNGN
ncbi:MAG: hypothetical protein WB562_06170 [Candidatus Sulfotelmatobacter sp.]